MHKRIFRSSSAQIIVFIARFAQQILLVPLFLVSWGTLAYADWLFLYSATLFASFADFGMQTYFANRLQETWARQETAEHQQVFSTMLGAHLLAICLVISAAALSTLAIEPATLFNLRVISPDVATKILWLLSGTTILGVIQGVFVQLYRARERFDRTASAATLLLVLQTMAISAALSFKATPLETAWANFAASGLSCLLIMYDCKRIYQDIRYRLALPDRRGCLEIYAKAPFFMLSNMAALGVQNGPVLVVGQFATSPIAIVSFTLLRTFTGLIRMVANQFAMSTTVEIVHHHMAGKERAGISRLFLDATATITAIIGAPSGLLWVIGSFMLAIWSRHHLAFDRNIFTALLLAAVLAAPAQIPTIFLAYTNRPRSMAISNVGLLVFGVGLGIPATIFYGAGGMAWLLLIVEMVLFPGYLAHKVCALFHFSYLRFLMFSFGIAMTTMVLGGFLAQVLLSLIRPDSIYKLIGFGAAWVCVVVVVVAAVSASARAYRRPY